MEIWRDIEGYEGYYQVSSLGNVRSLDRYIPHRKSGLQFCRGKVLCPRMKEFGYNCVHLAKDGIIKEHFVHRLVVLAFPEICGEWFEGAQVNHKNEVKTDNRAENLETCTASYNSNYGTHRLKLSNALKGRQMPEDAVKKMAMAHKKPIVAFYPNGVRCHYFGSAQDANRKYQFLNYVSISACLHGRLKTYRGLNWTFTEKYVINKY